MFLLALVYAMLVYFGIEVVPALESLLPAQSWTGTARLFAEVSAFATASAFYMPAGVVMIIATVVVALPGWTGTGRTFADRLPVFSLYRIYTGMSVLVALSSLMADGRTPSDAIEQIHRRTNPYVRHRLMLVRHYLLNGSNLGSAMHLAGTGWPDRELNLSLKVFSRSHNLPGQIAVAVDAWLDEMDDRLKLKLAILRNATFLVVFLSIAFVVTAICDVQQQVAASL